MSNISKSDINDMKSQLVEISGVSSEILDNEIIKTLVDTSKIVSVANSILNVLAEKKLTIFLKSLSGDNLSERQQQKLREYMKKEKRRDFVLELYRKVIESQTNKAPIVLGVIANEIVFSDKDASHEDLICINALMQFYDFDFENLTLLHTYVSRGDRKYFTLYNQKLKDFLSTKKADVTSITLTLEKCVNLQLIKKEYESDISVDIDVDGESADVSNQEVDAFYSFNSVGEKLVTYIKKAKIVE
ncbi:hypothetical protein LZ480_07655 [Solibacillus sp. MA9]|uniref:DUF4393 domain-containing protein n=1 Tax=Solibacillus palustris TaxID=2908203 RepID=A0ABS9UBP0_9BACL|nr:hypothetical protein [Solibacillus sp. MA9]MCH7321767.1 hypothetical protein [Solibacillus sp. MA9]